MPRGAGPLGPVWLPTSSFQHEFLADTPAPSPYAAVTELRLKCGLWWLEWARGWKDGFSSEGPLTVGRVVRNNKPLPSGSHLRHRDVTGVFPHLRILRLPSWTWCPVPSAHRALCRFPSVHRAGSWSPAAGARQLEVKPALCVFIIGASLEVLVSEGCRPPSPGSASGRGFSAPHLLRG